MQPYVKTVYEDDSTPAISAENLNKSEQGIYDAYTMSSDVSKYIDRDALTPYASTSGVLLSNGTISTHINLSIDKYNNLQGKFLCLNGTGGFDTGNGFCYLWQVASGVMVSYIEVTAKPQVFDNTVITLEDGVTEVWVCHGSNLIGLYETFMEDGYSREHIAVLEDTLNKYTDISSLTPYSTINGLLLSDGTISTQASIVIDKYKDLEGKDLYLNGTGAFDLNHGFCYLWQVTNGEMVSYIGVTAKPQVFENTRIFLEEGVEEVWVCHGALSIGLYESTIKDGYARDRIEVLEAEIENAVSLGSQWNGKKWYAYGTSLTSVHQGTGKYPTYVQQFSNLILTEKGIAGGAICNNKQIKQAVMNTTDGKLEADLITLEIGANDTTAPLGTIYDTGDSTFCGALNQCIRYLQANTSAQIVIISSTNARKHDNNTPAAPEDTYGSDNHTKFDQWEATRKVCELNSCYYIPMGETANMSYARMNASNAYNTDNIHHTDLGGYNLAEFVWFQLRNIPCWLTSIPT